MRGAALACLLMALALAGCMQWDSGSDQDWDAYDSGRGLAFGTLLTILLVVGAAILVANLTSSRPRKATAPPPTPQAPVPAGWEPVEPAEPSQPAPKKATAKRASKSAKPRRPSP